MFDILRQIDQRLQLWIWIVANLDDEKWRRRVSWTLIELDEPRVLVVSSSLGEFLLKQFAGRCFKNKWKRGWVKLSGETLLKVRSVFTRKTACSNFRLVFFRFWNDALLTRRTIPILIRKTSKENRKKKCFWRTKLIKQINGSWATGPGVMHWVWCTWSDALIELGNGSHLTVEIGVSNDPLWTLELADAFEVQPKQLKPWTGC